VLDADLTPMAVLALGGFLNRIAEAITRAGAAAG
jgi:hypothetical protein